MHIVCTKCSFTYFKSAQSMHMLQVKCANSLHKVFIYLPQVCTKYLLITKCVSSAPDADFADFADLVHTPPIMDSWGGQWTGASTLMMAHWLDWASLCRRACCRQCLAACHRRFFFSGKSGLARARRSMASPFLSSKSQLTHYNLKV